MSAFSTEVGRGGSSRMTCDSPVISVPHVGGQSDPVTISKLKERGSWDAVIFIGCQV